MLSQARLKSEAIDNKYQQVKIRLQLSTIFCLSGETDKAQQEAAEVLKFAKENALENLTASGLISLGSAFMARGDLAQAEKYLNQALEIAQYYNARRSEGKALLMLASFYTQHQGKADKIQELVERAASINEQEGYRKYAIQSQAILGHANEQQGNYVAALRAFEQQLQLAEQMDDQEQVALAHEGLGITLAHQEDYTEALRHLNEHVRISKSLKEMQPNIAHALLNQGNVFWQMGDYKDAEAALAEARRVANESAEPDEEFLAWYHLFNAQLALSQRTFASVQTEGKEALKLSKDRYEEITAETKYTLGLAQSLAGFPRAGQALCDDALAIANRIANQRLIFGATLARSVALLENGDAQAALETALKAQEGFARSGRQDSEWRAWLIAARAAKRQGDNPRALELAMHAAEVFSTLQQKWQPEAFRVYQERPDVQYFRRQLEEEFNL
jgi:tetratricopeptide (TPR) repeat protein